MQAGPLDRLYCFLAGGDIRYNDSNSQKVGEIRSCGAHKKRDLPLLFGPSLSPMTKMELQRTFLDFPPFLHLPLRCPSPVPPTAFVFQIPNYSWSNPTSLYIHPHTNFLIIADRPFAMDGCSPGCHIPFSLIFLGYSELLHRLQFCCRRYVSASGSVPAFRLRNSLELNYIILRGQAAVNYCESNHFHFEEQPRPRGIS